MGKHSAEQPRDRMVSGAGSTPVGPFTRDQARNIARSLVAPRITKAGK